jgi:hypothetical protein
MDKVLSWLKSEPAIVWTTGGTALAGAIQADPYLITDAKNYLTLAIAFGVALIVRSAVTPSK